jgi:hypothetical protein
VVIAIILWYHKLMHSTTSTVDCAVVTLRLPTWLYDAVKTLAEERGISVNQFITEALKKAVKADRIRLAREGYAEYGREARAELEEGMAEWSEMLERDDAR